MEEARRAEEAQRVEEECQAEMVRQAEAARRQEEAERQKVIDEAQARMEREQQEEMQAWVQAIMVMQGGGTPGPSTAVAVPILRACERCTVQLGEPEGCVVSERGKVWACLSCQKARKVCVWPLGLAEATVAMGSRTEGSGKPAPRHVVKWRTATMTNTSPRGGEKRKKACTTTEEGEDDEDTEEVFRVPRAMAEEQRDTLGMLTQTLAQVVEMLAAVEARDKERLAMEREWMEIQRAHLAITRRAADWDEERLELERVRTSLGQQWTEDLWWMGTLMRSPFVYSAKGKEKEVKTGAEEKGDKADNKDEDMQGEEE